MENNFINSNIVEHIMHTTTAHAILKDAKTGKYIDINAPHLSVYNLQKANELVGLTIWDLNNFMDKMWLDNAEDMTKFEEQVVCTKSPVIQPKRVWLNADGFVWVHHMSKIPIIGQDNKVTAILGLGNDLTKSCNLQELYSYYCRFYPEQYARIKIFLKHMKILPLFNEIPSHAEIIVLIHRVIYVNNKQTADALGLKISTIESHINKLNQKTNQFQLACNILRAW